MSDVTRTEIIKAQVPTEMADALRGLAEQHERTLSAEIRLALRAYLAEPRERVA